VTVAVPAAAQIPAKAGCGFSEGSNPVTTLIDRTQQWLRNLAH
jgi:hypothetical protein